MEIKLLFTNTEGLLLQSTQKYGVKQSYLVTSCEAFVRKLVKLQLRSLYSQPNFASLPQAPSHSPCLSLLVLPFLSHCLPLHFHFLDWCRYNRNEPVLEIATWVENRVGTVLPFSVFFGFWAFALFIRVSGRVFGPYLLREKSLYQLVGKNGGSLDYTE